MSSVWCLPLIWSNQSNLHHLQTMGIDLEGAALDSRELAWRIPWLIEGTCFLAGDSQRATQGRCAN
jgi:hypothetical protein